MKKLPFFNFLPKNLRTKIGKKGRVLFGTWLFWSIFRTLLCYFAHLATLHTIPISKIPAPFPLLPSPTKVGGASKAVIWKACDDGELSSLLRKEQPLKVSPFSLSPPLSLRTAGFPNFAHIGEETAVRNWPFIPPPSPFHTVIQKMNLIFMVFSAFRKRSTY